MRMVGERGTHANGSGKLAGKGLLGRTPPTSRPAMERAGAVGFRPVRRSLSRSWRGRSSVQLSGAGSGRWLP